MKIKSFLLLCSVCMTQLVDATNPKYEFRATWLTTGFSIDWPKSKNIELQKENLCKIFDVMERGNMNAACGQLSSDYRKSCYTASDITKEM